MVEQLKKHIGDMEAQIHEVEALQATRFVDDEKVLDVEASVGVAHYECVTNLENELVKLDFSISIAN